MAAFFGRDTGYRGDKAFQQAPLSPFAGDPGFSQTSQPPSDGVLGSAAPVGMQQPYMGSSTLGILGAALKDVGANLGGKPEDANNLQAQSALLRQIQARQALAAGMSSNDPKVRQQAYLSALSLGIDPAPYQKLTASQALPKLMNNLQPQFNQVGVTPQIQLGGAPGSGAAQVAQRTAAGDYSQPVTSQPSLSDALTATGSPELTAQMAPEVIKDQLDREAKAETTLTSAQAAALGFKPGSIVQRDENGNLKVAQASDLKSQGAVDQQLALENANPNLKVAQDRLAMDQTKAQAGIPNEDALHDMAVRYVHGDKTAFGSMGRNPMAQTAANNMISQVGKELGYAPQQISQNQQTFQAGTKAVQGFDTGKQGDTVRSLNVSVSHLETLKALGAALNNGDIRLINAAKQKFAEEFGVAAPTNFDAAKSIVADEVAKGVIGGQSAQSDRETLAASLRRSGGPGAINGAINTFQDLLGGQLRGLRQQYKSSTGRDDFNDKLFPDTLSVLDKPQKSKAPAAPQDLPRLPAAPQTKVINGKAYHQINGKWYSE